MSQAKKPVKCFIPLSGYIFRPKECLAMCKGYKVGADRLSVECCQVGRELPSAQEMGIPFVAWLRNFCKYKHVKAEDVR